MLKKKPIAYDRLDQLWTVFLLLGGLYAVRLVHLQVIRNVYFLAAAEQNRTQTIPQDAPRGKILDRKGRILATNSPSFSVIYLPAADEDPAQVLRLARELAPELGQKPAELAAELRAASRRETPTRLAENLDVEEMFRLSELKTRYAGIDLVLEARRSYPHGAFASHVLGYIGAMDPRSWRELRSKGYRADSWVGRSGIERLFERELRGLDGGVQLEVDARGRLKKVLRRLPWSPGGTVELALDLDLQRAAEEALRASSSGEGAVVVLDPRQGDVLALASLPDFDPNLLLVRKDTEIQETLRDLPEFNHAIQGTFPPGSIFKIISSAAGLEEGKMRPDEKVACAGSFPFGRRTFGCWLKSGHGRLAFLQGLAQSCDVYYYTLGLRTGGELIEKYEKLFRIGMKTHIALPGEQAGQRFGPEQRGRRGWWPGENLNLAIGQGELLVTPVQMAVMIAGVANGGTFYRPQLVLKVEDRYGRAVYERKSEVLGTAALSPATWELVRGGLKAVVEEGTARGVRIPGLDVRGKTGTAENPRGEDHAWFVAYAGPEDGPPELAVAVLVQHGGHGGAAAGPIARKVLQEAFRERLASAAKPKEASL